MPGVTVNQAFLADCLRAETFAAGRATTAFLDETFPDGWQPDRRQLLGLRARAAMALVEAPSDNPLHRTDGFRVTRPHRVGTAPLFVEDEYGHADLTLLFGPQPAVRSGEETLALDDGPGAAIWREGTRIHAAAGGLAVTLSARPLSEARVNARAEGQAAGLILAPLAGLVTKVYVASGDAVKAGEPLLEMEAMKLVHTLFAPFDGTVGRVSCAAGDTHGAKTVLIEMEEDA
jgi:acetyl/propionyl-CoA carboxylase alpha subunit